MSLKVDCLYSAVRNFNDLLMNNTLNLTIYIIYILSLEQSDVFKINGDDE